MMGNVAPNSVEHQDVIPEVSEQAQNDLTALDSRDVAKAVAGTELPDEKSDQATDALQNTQEEEQKAYERMQRVLENNTSNPLNLDAFQKITSERQSQLLNSLLLTRDVSLDGLTELSDPLVDVLQTSKNGISLNGITTRSPALDRLLKNYTGKSLSLDGLKELGDDVTLSLAVNPSFSLSFRELSLKGLQKISDKNLKELTSSQITKLSLSGITDQGTLQKLAKAAQALALDGLHPENQATVLATYNGRSLSLSHLDFSQLDGKLLQKFQGQKLVLHQTTFTEFDAAKLASYTENTNYQVSLRFDELPSSHPALVSLLQNFQGNSLELQGVTSLDPTLMEAALHFPGISLSFPDVKTLSSAQYQLFTAQ